MPSSRRRHTRSLCDWSSDVCLDRKSTRLNSSHTVISYAVFCLKKKEHTSELQSHSDLVCRLLLEKKKKRVRSCRSDECHRVSDVAKGEIGSCTRPVEIYVRQLSHHNTTPYSVSPSTIPI